MALIRPLSGSGALGVMSEIITTHGPDSFIGMLTCTIMGSTETTFYVLAVYFGAVGISRYRQALPAPADGSNYEFLNVKGRGHYVGTVMSVVQAEAGWFGEGDDFFWVDGQRPSIEGTGSEDYFNDAAATVAVHPVCSVRKMGSTDKLLAIAARCSAQVVSVDQVQCCGFAGERGFMRPELNEHALRHLKAALPVQCDSGVATSRTCEIGLSEQGGVPYRSIVYLVDACARAASALPTRIRLQATWPKLSTTCVRASRHATRCSARRPGSPSRPSWARSGTPSPGGARW